MGVKKGELQRLRDENSKLNNSIMSLRFIINNFFKSIEGLSVQQKVIFHGLLNELADYYTGDKKDGYPHGLIEELYKTTGVYFNGKKKILIGME